MMKSMKEKMKNRKGFTLVELVVVIAILGILAAIAIPKLSQSRVSASVAAHNANVRTIESAANMYIADGKADIKTATDIEGATLAMYLQKVPSIPKEAKLAGDPTNYQIIIDTGAITVTPKLRKVKADGTVEDQS